MAELSNRQNTPGDGATLAGRGAQQQVRLQMDERDMSTSYANAFRTNATSEEVFVDFGLNMIVPAPAASADGSQPAGQLMLKFNDRVILNYKTAKRLAITLGQVIRAHEERFGEIKLDQAPGADSAGR